MAKSRDSIKPQEVLYLGDPFADFVALLTSYTCLHTWHSYRTLFSSLKKKR